jgi:hypothetical protein
VKAPGCPAAPVEYVGRMHATLTATRERVLLERGRVRVEVALHPLRLHVRRDGRRLLRGAHVWVADGEVHDRFLQLTEGVMARELLGVPERAASAAVARATHRDGLRLALELQGGGRRSWPSRCRRTSTCCSSSRPAGARCAWRSSGTSGPRSASRGSGARHHPLVDHHGRAIQLGATVLHRPRLPARHARARRHPAGRLRPRCRGCRARGATRSGCRRGQRHPLRPRRRARPDRRLHPCEAGRCASTCSRGRRPAARLRAFLQLTGCRPCSPSGATGSGSRATSTTTRTTSWRT